jgi:hypothetical protein
LVCGSWLRLGADFGLRLPSAGVIACGVVALGPASLEQNKAASALPLKDAVWFLAGEESARQTI